jgi:hypothetical protein
VPVISLCKVPYIADLLGPVMKAEDAKLVHRYLPWAQKKNKAFFRWLIPLHAVLVVWKFAGGVLNRDLQDRCGLAGSACRRVSGGAGGLKRPAGPCRGAAVE